MLHNLRRPRPVTSSAVAGLTFVLFALASCTENNPTGAAVPIGDVALSAQSSGDTPVTATVADADTSVAPTLQIRSDGLGAYKNSSSLTSVIQSIGAWLLDSYNPRSATRRVDLVFSQPIAGSGPNGGNPTAIASGLYKVHAISKCNLLGTSFLTLAPGASMPCPLHIKFDYSGSSYAIQMNPGASAGNPDGSAPESNYATITCTVPSSGTGPCTAWTITPSGTFTAPDGTLKYQNVGKLLKYVTSKGQTAPVSQGDFYFSFAIGVSNP